MNLNCLNLTQANKKFKNENDELKKSLANSNEAIRLIKQEHIKTMSEINSVIHLNIEFFKHL